MAVADVWIGDFIFVTQLSVSHTSQGKGKRVGRIGVGENGGIAYDSFIAKVRFVNII